MDVAAGRTVGGINVGVSVNPEEADLLVLAAMEFRDSGHGARCNRVISA